MDKQAIVRYAASQELLLSNPALELLSQRDDFEKLIDELVKKNVMVASEEQVLSTIMAQSKLAVLPIKTEKENTLDENPVEVVGKKARYRILSDLDVTGQSNSEGKVGDFLHLFREKYEFVHDLLRRRQGLDPKPLSRMDRVVRNKEFHFIAMVRDKVKTKNGHYMLVVDDPEGSVKCMALKQDEKCFELVKEILMDDVVGFKAIRGNGDLIIIKDIIWPDLPQRPFKTSEEEGYACIISDIHVGSKLFLEGEFNRFLDWINGRSESEKEREDAGKIKYLFIVGDNVDGIGVYPNQYDNLLIPDINKQYEKLEELLLNVREDIIMFIIPGQHDAVRRAEPQPAIPASFFPRLSQRKNFHSLGNPTWVEIEGLKVLMYHGASLHDLRSTIDRIKGTEPQQAIIEVLKRRDLMAGYGVRNPYVAEKKNFMLVREEPDIYLGGDMHHAGYARYRGCLVINSSCWQAQTDFEMEMGHTPTPGIVPLISLKDGRIIEKKFMVE